MIQHREPINLLLQAAWVPISCPVVPSTPNACFFLCGLGNFLPYLRGMAQDGIGCAAGRRDPPCKDELLAETRWTWDCPQGADKQSAADKSPAIGKDLEGASSTQLSGMKQGARTLPRCPQHFCCQPGRDLWCLWQAAAQEKPFRQGQREWRGWGAPWRAKAPGRGREKEQGAGSAGGGRDAVRSCAAIPMLALQKLHPCARKCFLVSITRRCCSEVTQRAESKHEDRNHPAWGSANARPDDFLRVADAWSSPCLVLGTHLTRVLLLELARWKNQLQRPQRHLSLR